MCARQSAIHGNGLAIDVGGLVAGQEERHGGDLLGLARPLQRVELADLGLVPCSRARSKIGRVIPVSIRPGQMALTRTPVPVSVLAAVCTRLITPALLAL